MTKCPTCGRPYEETLFMSRKGDHDTSKVGDDPASLIGATKVVWTIMCDGVARSDTEIADIAWSMGSEYTDSRLRHGRLALLRVGVLKDSGLKSKTPSGRPTKQWVAVKWL